jgi:hypothetical protein
MRFPTLASWATNPGHVRSPDANQLPDGSFIIYYSASTKLNPRQHCIAARGSSAKIRKPSEQFALGTPNAPLRSRQDIGSTPRVRWYIDGPMGQPPGLSMVNSQYRLYTLHLATLATYRVTCPPTPSTQDWIACRPP